VKYWTRALIGLGLVTAGLALENHAVFKLALIGTCASGGPYVSARPCPPGTGTTILSIFLALLIAAAGLGVFAARGGGTSKGLATLGLGTMAWSLGFLTNGVTMLIAAYGPAASTGPGSKTGAIIVAATFIPLGLGPLLLLPLRRFGRSKTEELEEKGRQAPGVVTAVRDTGVTINQNPRVHVDVRVEPPGEEPFPVTHTATISRVSLPRTGDHVTVIYDPGDHSKAEVRFAPPPPVAPSTPLGMPATWSPGAPPPRAATPGQDPAALEKLQKLGELHASGVLTDAEFAAQKAKLLGEI